MKQGFITERQKGPRQPTKHHQKPLKMSQVYSATYSGVEVYEFINATGSVMRRKSDGWVNATHILKAANFPKAKRTRILERDIQHGEHEKVQGGYGKYQGTWVPLDRAREVAREFKVDDILSPLFDLERTFGANSPPPAPKHHHASKSNSIVEKPVRKTAASARKTASMPVMKQSAGEIDDTLQKKRGRPRRLNVPVSDPNKGVFTGKRLKSNAAFSEIPSSPLDSSRMTSDDENTAITEDININDGLSSEIDENINIGSSSPSEFMSDTDLANALKSPNQEVHQSARESLERAITNHTEQIKKKTSSDKWFDTTTEYTSRLLEYFMTPDNQLEQNVTEIPEFILNPPKDIDFDQIIDDEGNTLFHWACSMGNSQIIEAWIKLGANYRVVNKLGETSLMRSVLFTNSFNKKTFSRMVELLSETIFEFDNNHMTVLHHIVNTATSKIRIPSAVYYMDILLAKISAQSIERLHGFLNLQDNNGNTALHISAKNSNRKCIKLLLEYKANHSIRNNQGLVASDILLDKGNITPKVQQRYESLLGTRNQRIQRDFPPAPHVSEAAIEATHKVSNYLIESLNELSNAYDAQLHRKEADVVEVEELLKNINEDIRLTKLKTQEFLNEDLSDDQLDKRISRLKNEVERYENITTQKETKLNRILERSQAKMLSDLVQSKESEINERELQFAKNNKFNDYDKIYDIVTLTKYQLRRKKLICDIIQSYTGVHGEINTKLRKFRRLISMNPDLNVDEVNEKLDDLIKEIESAD